MTRYRKKPVEVEAWQVGSDEPKPEWINDVHPEYNGEFFGVDLDGDELDFMYASKGDFIIKDYGYVRLPSDIFEQTYEVVE